MHLSHVVLPRNTTWVPPLRREAADGSPLRPDFSADTLRAMSGAILEPWPRLREPHKIHYFDYATYYAEIDQRHEELSGLKPIYMWPTSPPTPERGFLVDVAKAPELRIAWSYANPMQLDLDLPGECGGGIAFSDDRFMGDLSHMHSLQIPLLKVPDKPPLHQSLHQP